MSSDVDGLGTSSTTPPSEIGRELVERVFADPELAGAVVAVVSRLVALEQETLTDADATWLAHHRGAERSGPVVALSPVATLERARVLVRSTNRDGWELADGLSLGDLLFRTWTVRWPGLPMEALRDLVSRETGLDAWNLALVHVFDALLESNRAEDWAALVATGPCPASVRRASAAAWVSRAEDLDTKTDTAEKDLLDTAPGAVVGALAAVANVAAVRQLAAFNETPRREWSRLALATARRILDALDDGSDEITTLRAAVCEGLLTVLTKDDNDLRLELGRTVFELGCEMVESHVGDPRYRLAMVGAANNLGLVLREAKQLDESLAVFERAFRDMPPPLAMGDIDVVRHALASLHNNYGTTLWHAERHEEALIEQRRALEIAETALRSTRTVESRTQVASVHLNMALTLRTSERPEEALDAWSAARAVLEALVAEGKAEHREGVARACYAMAMTYDDLGRLDEAYEAFEEAWRIAEALYFREGRTEHRWLVTGVGPRLSELRSRDGRDEEAGELVHRWMDAVLDGFNPNAPTDDEKP